MKRFFAAPQNFDGGKIRLDEDETRHLRDVMRLNEGEAVRVFDGIGREFECRIGKIDKHSSRLELLRPVAPLAPESQLHLTICAAILKGDKTDVAIQKAVELGVKRFVPLITNRTDVNPRSADRRIERWRKIVMEASKQCGRATLMTVEDISTVEAAFQNGIDGQVSSGLFLFFSERDGGKLNVDVRPKNIIAFIGPEGGWDDPEIEFARASGATVVTLHGRILKADTAAIAISAILQHHFGDLN